MVAFLSFVTLSLAGLAVASPLELRTESHLQKRDPVDCPSNPSVLPFINDAITEGKALANGAINYLNTNGVNDPLFMTYFGDLGGVVQHYVDIFATAANETSLTWNCVDPSTTCTNPASFAGSIGAYSSNPGPTVFFCPGFFARVDTGHLCSGTSIDSGTIRSSTTLDQLLGFDLGVFNQGIGCENARSLVSTNLGNARSNVDNYSCFAMQVYINTHCPS